ncbi:MAG: hypothetical protein WCX71_04525 [Candidatus Buchananbacteria bacterium]
MKHVHLISCRPVLAYQTLDEISDGEAIVWMIQYVAQLVITLINSVAGMASKNNSEE